jgi:hypothetical protein
VHEGIKSYLAFSFGRNPLKKVVVRNVDVSTLFRTHWNPILERMNAVQPTERKEQKKKKKKRKKKRKKENRSWSPLSALASDPSGVRAVAAAGWVD